MNLKGNTPQVAPSKDKPKARTGAFSVATSSKPRNGMDCAHCQRVMNNFEGGYSRGYKNEPLCHPNAKNRPDCYKLVTTYNHPTPCNSSTCYENHGDFLTYVKAFELQPKEDKPTRTLLSHTFLEKIDKDSNSVSPYCGHWNYSSSVGKYGTLQFGSECGYPRAEHPEEVPK